MVAVITRGHSVSSPAIPHQFVFFTSAQEAGFVSFYTAGVAIFCHHAYNSVSCAFTFCPSDIGSWRGHHDQGRQWRGYAGSIRYFLFWSLLVGSVLTNSVADGTPRDCSSNRCGSQADTAIIRDREIRSGETGPLGRTQGNGPIDAATMITNFMGGAPAPTNNGANSSVGVEDNIDGAVSGRGGGRNRNRVRRTPLNFARQFLKGLFGSGGTASTEATESNVASTAGVGASSGLPTCGDDGSIEMVFHQVCIDVPNGPISPLKYTGKLTNSRSTKTALALLTQPSTQPRAALTRQHSRPPKSRRMFPVWVSKGSVWRRIGISR